MKQIKKLTKLAKLTKHGDNKLEVELAKLYQVIADSAQSAFFSWSEATALEEISQAESWVALKDQVIVSFITFRHYSDRIEIMALGTRPGFTGTGEARGLLSLLKNYAAKKVIPVWLEVHCRNVKAILLYESLGFALAQRRKSYYKDGSDALTMTLQPA